MSDKEASERTDDASSAAPTEAKAEPAEAERVEPKPDPKPDPKPEPKPDHAHAHDDYHHAPSRKEYIYIWLILFILTVLEVGVAYTTGYVGKTALVGALVLLALAKAGCVALFYMHLKHETKVMRWTVLFPFAFPALYAFVLIAEGMYRALWGG
jgi:caa(3)-type oxidase subunit IV